MQTLEAQTDQELAKTLVAAEKAYQADFTDETVEAYILVQNAICERINVPLDEIEQGLTDKAWALIDAFVEKNLDAA